MSLLYILHATSSTPIPYTLTQPYKSTHIWYSCTCYMEKHMCKKNRSKDSRKIFHYSNLSCSLTFY